MDDFRDITPEDAYTEGDKYLEDFTEEELEKLILLKEKIDSLENLTGNAYIQAARDLQIELASN